MRFLSFTFILLTAMTSTKPVAAGPETLAEQVTIYRDEYGTPHVFGKTDATTVFGFAYAQAEDNFPQMEENLVFALGRASEVFGAETLDEDRLNHALEIPRHAQEDYAAFTPQFRAICDAYAAGVNYYLARHPDVHPRLLQKLEPWFPLAFIRYSYYQNGFARDPKLGRELVRTAWVDPLSPEHNGSNGWVVAPSRSANGHAMLFINPHLGFFGPSQVYEGHIHSEEGWEFTGYARFGFPFPYIGHNADLGWMSTDNMADQVDGYIETFDVKDDPLSYRYGKGHRKAQQHVETILVKTPQGMDRRSFRMLRTHHGPIITSYQGAPVAVRMPQWESHGWLGEWYRMTHARNLQDLKTAMAPLEMLFGNVMSADKDGNIFYVYNSAVPRRAAGFDWSKPVDGSDPRTEWQGHYSLEELPQLANPATGWMENCNTSPFLLTSSGNPDGSRYPKFMVREGFYPAWEDNNPRGRASQRVLSQNASFTFEQWSAAAFDTNVVTATELLPDWTRKIAAKDPTDEKMRLALKELSSWDGRSSVDSIAMTLFTEWHYAMRHKEASPETLKSTLSAVIAELERKFGSWRVPYGELNRMQRPVTAWQLPSKTPDFSDDQASLPTAAVNQTDGAPFTMSTVAPDKLKRHYGVHGGTYISVVEFGPTPRALSIMTFGESGDPKSKHFFDQAALYAEGKFKPSWWTLDEIKQHAERTYHPGEEAKNTRQ